MLSRLSNNKRKSVIKTDGVRKNKKYRKNNCFYRSGNCDDDANDNNNNYNNDDDEEEDEEEGDERTEELLKLMNGSQNKTHVFKSGNHIYFTDQVNTKSINQLVTLLNNTNKSYKNLVNAVSVSDLLNTSSLKIKPIYLHINSQGGSLIDGFRAMDVIESSNVPVYTVIEGEADSAASLMFCAGKKRFMTKNSVMLIHELRSSHYGKLSSCNDDHANSIMLHKKMVDIYYKKMDGTMTKKKIEQVLERDIYWDYETCKKYNLADALYTNENMHDDTNANYKSMV